MVKKGKKTKKVWKVIWDVYHLENMGSELFRSRLTDVERKGKEKRKL